jgi:serine kinase of HPr protein (carbohydrate metabolism regulator)
VSETAHATAVVVGEKGVLIRGASSAGKSMLAAALIKEGARLVADDRVHLCCCHGRVVATAPSTIAGLLEMRGLGLVRMEHEASAVIRLVVDLVGPDLLDRHPEPAAASATILGVPLPRQPVPAASPMSPLLVAAALAELAGTRA